MSFQNYYNPQFLTNSAHQANFTGNQHPFASHLLNQVAHQNQLLKSLNNELNVRLQAVLAQKQEMRSQNIFLSSSANVLANRPKRKYSKRRTWLQKKYSCPSSDCPNKYSSMIALNLHIRKHHLLENQVD